MLISGDIRFVGLYNFLGSFPHLPIHVQGIKKMGHNDIHSSVDKDILSDGYSPGTGETVFLESFLFIFFTHLGTSYLCAP